MNPIWLLLIIPATSLVTVSATGWYLYWSWTREWKDR